MAGSKSFMKDGPKVVPHVDRFLHKVSGGKFISSGGGGAFSVLGATRGPAPPRRAAAAPPPPRPRGEPRRGGLVRRGQQLRPGQPPGLDRQPDEEPGRRGVV